MQLPNTIIESVFLGVFSIFCVSVSLQLWYYLKIFLLLASYKKEKISNNLPPVSIVICARNEDDNLIEFLPSVLNQDYPEFEVIVVNDCSDDNTEDILEEFVKKHNHLRVVTIKEDENHFHGKKFALMVGIKGAKYEHLLLTDADCKPASKDWIKGMISNFTDEAEIVLGYGAYEKTKGLLNKLIRFDTFYIALQYFSFCLAGKTYMGVGRNLAYRKTLFFKLKGFASHYHIESGDDDLFVNQAATKQNSKIEISLESFTVSKAKKTYKGWLHQKRRHVTTAKHYNTSTKFRLLLLNLSQYLFFISFIALLVLQYQIYTIISLFILRAVIQMRIFKTSMEKLDEKDLFLFSPLFEMFLMFFYPLVTLSNFFLKKNKWTR